MNFSLIICTYERRDALLRLLTSVNIQSEYPNEILIIDGSITNDTAIALETENFKDVKYFKVDPQNRGLTRQRNVGISKVLDSSDIVCFLDDDVILSADYFKILLETYTCHPHAVGVGGYISNEIEWSVILKQHINTEQDYIYDGWKRKDSKRFIWRKKLGLDSDCPPGFSPLYSHGRSIGFLPPSGKVYPAELLMGGVSSFRKSVFDEYKFSTYFEGYGLYEDADFCLRVSKKYRLFINTGARLEHHHDSAGRPNMYIYGKMVVRNGWYVWRVKNPKPDLKDHFKWNFITLLLLLIRFTNIFSTDKKMEAFTESCGRFNGLCSLIFNKPKNQENSGILQNYNSSSMVNK